jgi:hypothetical protein
MWHQAVEPLGAPKAGRAFNLQAACRAGRQAGTNTSRPKYAHMPYHMHVRYTCKNHDTYNEIIVESRPPSVARHIMPHTTAPSTGVVYCPACQKQAASGVQYCTHIFARNCNMPRVECIMHLTVQCNAVHPAAESVYWALLTCAKPDSGIRLND